VELIEEIQHNSLGYHPGAVGRSCLRIIGAGPALDFILRSRVVSPDQALALGLVSEVAGDARARALEVAQSLAGVGGALAAAKRSVLRGRIASAQRGLQGGGQDAFLATNADRCQRGRDKRLRCHDQTTSGGRGCARAPPRCPVTQLSGSETQPERGALGDVVETMEGSGRT